MLQSSEKRCALRAFSALPSIFILTTEFIRGIFPPVPANLPDRPYAGRIHREDSNA
jgi:hypothetical protein